MRLDRAALDIAAIFGHNKVLGGRINSVWVSRVLYSTFFMHFLEGYMYPPRQLVLSTALLAYHFNFPGKLLCCHYILSSFLYLFQEEMLLLLTVDVPAKTH
jgi:hypothetical protein